MAEWSKAHDWKSCVRLKRTKGSNPFLSAILIEKTPDCGVFFCIRGVSELSRGLILQSDYGKLRLTTKTQNFHRLHTLENFGKSINN